MFLVHLKWEQPRYTVHIARKTLIRPQSHVTGNVRNCLWTKHFKQSPVCCDHCQVTTSCQFANTDKFCHCTNSEWSRSMLTMLSTPFDNSFTCMKPLCCIAARNFDNFLYDDFFTSRLAPAGLEKIKIKCHIATVSINRNP